MKKFICSIIAIIMLMSSAFAADSPDFLSMYHVEPEMNFYVVQNDDEWYAIYDTVHELMDFDTLFEDDYYGLYEIINVEIDDSYENIVWTFPLVFNDDQIIKFVFCAMDLSAIIVCDAVQNEDDTVALNGSEIVPNSYYMLVFASDTFDI